MPQLWRLLDDWEFAFFLGFAYIDRKSKPHIMKAKKKPLETLALDSLGVDAAPRIKLLSVSPPPERKGGIKVESVEQLVDKLRNEAKVIS